MSRCLTLTNFFPAALGFLAFKENGQSFVGNQGLKDQQMALKWVNKNIENFGGDPDKVSVFLQSLLCFKQALNNRK